MVRQHGNQVSSELHSQALTVHIDGRDDVRIFGFWRHGEPLAEDVEAQIAANEPDQVVPPRPGFGQRHTGRQPLAREAQRVLVRGELCGRRELSVAQAGSPASARASHLYTQRRECPSEAAMLRMLSPWWYRRTAAARSVSSRRTLAMGPLLVKGPNMANRSGALQGS